VSDSYNDAQLVLTFFQRWAAWADLTIRPDKSFAYGAAQRSGHYQQILPNFHVNGQSVPVIALGAPMVYLGRSFTFSADAERAKNNLIDILGEVLTFVDSLPISPHLKCHALNLQIRAKLTFTLSHHTLCSTWLRTHLDNMVTGRVRSWLELPPSATILFVPLPLKLLGLDLILPSMLAELCQLGTEMTLAQSKDTGMHVLGRLVHENAPSPFYHLVKQASRKSAMKAAKAV